jgi:hypothetical protein
VRILTPVSLLTSFTVIIIYCLLAFDMDTINYDAT